MPMRHVLPFSNAVDSACRLNFTEKQSLARFKMKAELIRLPPRMETLESAAARIQCHITDPCRLLDRVAFP
jgi:hypothetical protein